MTYQAIINGARGLVYFGGHLTKACTPEDAKLGWNWTFWSHVLRPVVEEHTVPVTVEVPKVETYTETVPDVRPETRVRRVPVRDHVFAYAKRITRMTRPNTPEAADFVNKWLTWGAGPRASMNLILAAKAHAILEGRHHVSADDVAVVALPILRHRLIINFTAQPPLLPLVARPAPTPLDRHSGSSRKDEQTACSPVEPTLPLLMQ